MSQQGRASFLKKRSKKLLLLSAWGFGGCASPAHSHKGFLVIFFQKSNRFLP
jgi:hypothetical protein